MPGEWRDQLPTDLKANEAFTSFDSLGDFAKAHIDTLGKVKASDGKFKEVEGKVTDLTNKLNNSIPKIAERATDEEKTAFYKALGKPEKYTEYEFPKTAGIEHDPKMVEWAQKTFHGAHLSKDQAATISAAWDGFMSGMVKAEQDAKAQARADAEKALKEELKDQYEAAVELTKRLLKEHAGPEDMAFLEESGMGNHPALIRLIVKFAKKTGEDSTLKGGPPKGKEPAIGINYDKSDMSKFAT